MEKIMVFGGAGYIGSHVVKALGEKGYDVVTVDNLSTGFRQAVLYGRFYQEDLLDLDGLREVVAKEKPDAVMHFAAFIIVPESVEKPLLYYRNNVVGSLNLLQVLQEHGVDKFIFSSTAAVYGNPTATPIAENHPLLPINPYGHSKAMVEQVIRDCTGTSRLRYVVLRYFNVVGADPEGKLGERKENATHLVTVAIKVAEGKIPALQIFGNDYDTPDGTCIRDYIHVSDLAGAHVTAIEHLLDGGESDVFNCGCGKGVSVLEVIEAVNRVTGRDFKVLQAARRAGDPPVLVADPGKIKSKLGWRAQYTNLDFMIRTSWEWEKKRPSLCGEAAPGLKKITFGGI